MMSTIFSVSLFKRTYVLFNLCFALITLIVINLHSYASESSIEDHNNHKLRNSYTLSSFDSDSRDRYDPSHEYVNHAFPIEGQNIEELVNISSNLTGPIAGISGGGPAGLAAAIALKKKGLFSQVMVFEKRDTYSRVHMVNLTKHAILSLIQLDQEIFIRMLESQGGIYSKH